MISELKHCPEVYMEKNPAWWRSPWNKSSWALALEACGLSSRGPALACLPRILLARCSLEVIIWSMSVRMTASMAGWACCSLESTSSKRAWACAYTRRYTASEICGQSCGVSTRLRALGQRQAPRPPAGSRLAHLDPLPLALLRFSLQAWGKLRLQFRAQFLHHQVAQDLGPGGTSHGRS